MPTDGPDPNASPSESSSESRREKSSSRRQPLTPELRKFLGPGRSWHDREAAKEEAEAAAEIASQKEMSGSELPPSVWPGTIEPAEAPPPPPPAKTERRRTPQSTPALVPDQKISRALEMQTVAIIAGVLILLGGTFYAGTKARNLKAFLTSSNKPEISDANAKKFPGLSSEELVEQALVAERLGNWKEAVERLLVAKHRDMTGHGIIFHAAKLCYDHGDFDSADRLLERAIVYGDQVDTANYLRGLIAVGRNDLPAAEQFFEAAVNAEPFTPGYYYYLGETLRREHRSKEAVVRYDQAASRTVNEPDALLCRFKARMARAETVDHPQLQNEVEQKRNAGSLSLDWLLTDAALKLRTGQIAEAVQLIEQAKGSPGRSLPTLFAWCTSDMLFTEAATNHPEIAAACRVGSTPNAPKPTPVGSP
jgi:tetratricopeptide (TPR) repeat protein